MYAIIATGGKQYKVSEGDVIYVEKLDGEAGDEVTLEPIFINDGKKLVTDEKKLARAYVSGEIVEQFKGKKQIVFKFKKRKNYKKKNGHRQRLCKVQINKIRLTKPRAKSANETAE